MVDAEAQSPVAPGEVFAGKYRVERVLGLGGMGVVVAATHLELDERVAVKFLLPDIAKIPEAVARFLHEGRAAVKIRSEHVAHVKDVGRLPDGAPYMVMEYLEGEDVGSSIDRGPLPVALAVDYLLQAIEAIAEAHSIGIVHRDLKPTNLFVTHRADGTACVKVLDFGIAKTLAGTGRAVTAMTSTSSAVGTPVYMSPEQLESSPDLDMRADVWSLGVILFEMLTGEPPFTGDTMPQLCTAILSSRPRSVRSLRSDVPRELAEAIERCLAKLPADRFANVAELAVSIAHLAMGEGRSSAERARRVFATRASVAEMTPPPVQAQTVVHGAPTESGITLPRSPKASSRAAILGVAIGGAVVAIAGLTALLLLRDHGSQSTASPDTSAASAQAIEPAITVSPVVSPPVVTSASASAAPSVAESASAKPAVPVRKVVKKPSGDVLPDGRK